MSVEHLLNELERELSTFNMQLPEIQLEIKELSKGNIEDLFQLVDKTRDTLDSIKKEDLEKSSTLKEDVARVIKMEQYLINQFKEKRVDVTRQFKKNDFVDGLMNTEKMLYKLSEESRSTYLKIESRLEQERFKKLLNSCYIELHRLFTEEVPPLKDDLNQYLIKTFDRSALVNYTDFNDLELSLDTVNAYVENIARIYNTFKTKDTDFIKRQLLDFAMVGNAESILRRNYFTEIASDTTCTIETDPVTLEQLKNFAKQMSLNIKFKEE